MCQKRLDQGNHPLPCRSSVIDRIWRRSIRDGGLLDVQVLQQKGRFTTSSVDSLAKILRDGFKTLTSEQSWAEEEIAQLVSTL